MHLQYGTYIVVLAYSCSIHINVLAFTVEVSCVTELLFDVSVTQKGVFLLSLSFFFSALMSSLYQ